jgi:hypothetical protein
LAKKQLILWHALLVIEELQTAWKAKLNNSKYALYHDAISDQLEKPQKTLLLL